MAPVAAVPAVEEGDGALALGVRDHLELGAEAPHEEALEARLLGVAQLGLARAELAAGGVDPVDEIEQLGRAHLRAAGEDVIGIQPLPVFGGAVLGHGGGRVT